MNVKPTFDSLLARVKSGEAPLDLENARSLSRLAVETGVYSRTSMQALREVAYRAPKGDAVGRAYADSFGVAGTDATYNSARENLNPAGWSDLERSFPAMRYFAPSNFIEAYSRAFGGDGRAPYIRVDAKVMKSLELHTGNFVRARTIGREPFERLLEKYPRAQLDETGHVRGQPDVENLYREKFTLLEPEKIDAKEPLRVMREYLEAKYK